MNQAFHVANRKRFAEASSGGLVVLAGYQAMQESGDMAAPFVQEANFWWLTGIEQPGWHVIIDTARHHTTLVRPAMTTVQITFEGQMSDEDVTAISGCDNIIASKDFEAELRQLRRKHSVVHTVYEKNHYDFVANPAAHELHATLSRIFSSVLQCDKQLHALRAIKQPEEIARMRKAIALTCDAFKAVRGQLQEYKHEYEIEADFTRTFRRKNARHAYTPIVAQGDNACTLHYVDNSDKVTQRKMILIDIGARVDGYCADITRTYAINPTKRQIAVHAAVERAQRRVIALLKPGLLVTDYIHEVDEIMKDALQEVDLLKDRNDTDTYRKYFPHSISHGLGIDPHDSLGSPRYFEPGMVLTSEPGIYIPEEGIGVRIEDDILITTSGSENLSRSLPTAL